MSATPAERSIVMHELTETVELHASEDGERPAGVSADRL